MVPSPYEARPRNDENNIPVWTKLRASWPGMLSQAWRSKAVSSSEARSRAGCGQECGNSTSSDPQEHSPGRRPGIQPCARGFRALDAGDDAHRCENQGSSTCKGPGRVLDSHCSMLTSPLHSSPGSCLSPSLWSQGREAKVAKGN